MAKEHISEAIACALAANAGPDDAVVIRAGLYLSPLDRIGSNSVVVPRGTVGHPFTIKAYCATSCDTSPQPFFAGPSAAADVVIMRPPEGLGAIHLAPGTRHVTIENLELDMIRQTPNTIGEAVFMDNDVQHVTIQRCRIHDASWVGVHISSPFVTLRQNDIFNSGRGWVNPNGTQGHAVYWSAPDGLAEGNYLHDNLGYGLHFNSTDAFPDIINREVARGNRIARNGGSGIVFDRGHDNIAYNNIIYGNHDGVSIYTESINTKIYNNTVVNNVGDGIWARYISGNAYVRQNIIGGNGNDGASNGGVVDYGNHNPLAVIVIENNYIGLPSFTNASIGDYSLATSTSPPVDVASCLPEVTVDFVSSRRPIGPRCDSGAYEYRPLGASGPSSPRNLVVAP